MGIKPMFPICKAWAQAVSFLPCPQSWFVASWQRQFRSVCELECLEEEKDHEESNLRLLPSTLTAFLQCLCHPFFSACLGVPPSGPLEPSRYTAADPCPAFSERNWLLLIPSTIPSSYHHCFFCPVGTVTG